MQKLNYVSEMIYFRVIKCKAKQFKIIYFYFLLIKRVRRVAYVVMEDLVGQGIELTTTGFPNQRIIQLSRWSVWEVYKKGIYLISRSTEIPSIGPTV